MITSTMRQDAASTALATLHKLGHAELIDSLFISWGSRFTGRMGDALYVGDSIRASQHRSRQYALNGRIVHIRFSCPLWPRATETERTQTVIHEVCHLVANHEAYLAGRPRPKHGREWKAVMRRAGVAPERCHNVSNKGLGQKKVRTTCSCGEHYVTSMVAGRILSNWTYTCGKCRGKLTVVDLSAAQIAACKASAAKKAARKEAKRASQRSCFGF